MKNIWQTISETLNCRKGNRDFPQEFKLSNGNKISEPKQIADAFNDFFVGIGDVNGDVNGDGDVDANTINDFNQYMPSKTNCTLMFEQITVDIISRIIGNLKHKRALVLIICIIVHISCTSKSINILNPDISSKLLKFVKNVISEPLSIIINEMLK